MTLSIPGRNEKYLGLLKIRKPEADKMDGASCERRHATDLPPAWARTGKRTFKNKSSWDWHNEKFIAHYSCCRRSNLCKCAGGWKQRAAFLAGFTFLLRAIAAEHHATGTATNVMDMDLESLMKIEVTSVSKRPEKLSDAAAAIYVITQETSGAQE